MFNKIKIINNTKSVNESPKNKDSYNISDEAKMIDKVESIESAVNNSFFYSNHKVFEQMDVTEILSYITQKYPAFSTDNKDSVIKKALLEIINNEEFVKRLLRRYDITVLDLFKIFSKHYASLFKGQYLKKLRAKLETKSYAQTIFRK